MISKLYYFGPSNSFCQDPSLQLITSSDTNNTHKEHQQHHTHPKKSKRNKEHNKKINHNNN